MSTKTSIITLADVDISPNPNTFNFWTPESEYIKKKQESEYIFSKLKESLNPISSRHKNPHESIYGLESEYISFFAIEYEYNYLVRDMDLSPITRLTGYS